ncbi:MAG: hypothetical protein DHS20C02_00210 [Micavibrio sp.]|nr:MAG: hypothetical protein DHS20C02_00210 [Micavibrio sp.]
MKVFQYRYISLGFLLIILLVAGKLSLAADMLEVEIRQINPDGPVYTGMCSREYEKCYMTMEFLPKGNIESAEKEHMDVVISFDSDGAYFHFMRGREYLFTSNAEKYNIKFPVYELMAKKHEVRLYKPHPLSKTDPHGALVLRTSSVAVAELEISARPGPPAVAPEEILRQEPDGEPL